MSRWKYALLIISLVTFALMLSSPGSGKAAAGEITPGPEGTETAAAQFDRAAELKKTLGLSGSKNDREVGLLVMCMSNLKSIGTGLEMYATDNGSRYPASLSKITPAYLKTIPRGTSSKGEFEFEQGYKLTAGGKSYVLSCPGGAFTSINVPAGYPRYTPEKGIEIKPGVGEPRPPLTQKDKAVKLFEEGVINLPMIIQSKNKEQASAARAKLRAAIDSGGLSPSEKATAEKVIQDYDKIIKGTK